jgi:putative ABC transport system permease protein
MPVLTSDDQFIGGIAVHFDSWLQDLRIAARSLAKQNAWTAVAIVTLALGSGANTALFTIVNATLLRALPYPDADRIVSISETDKGIDHGTVPTPTFNEWSRTARSFSAFAAYDNTSAVFGTADGPEVVDGARVSASYFSVFAINPSRGRVFTADEDRPGGPDVVVLSEQFWRRSFGGDNGIVGKTVILDGAPSMVIGVMPASFTTIRRAQFWTPLRLAPVGAGARAIWYYTIVARLRTSSTITAARNELAAIDRRLDLEKPENARGWAPLVMTLHDRRYGDRRPALLLLFGAVGVLLLIACANVSSLLLARAARRQREFAVRIALGATRGRLVRYLICESVILALAGGLLGVGIAVVAVKYFVNISPTWIATVENIRVDGTVLLFTFAVCVVTGFVFGLVPATNAGRGDLATALGGGNARATHTARQNHLRRTLVVAELATALMLLTGAGLLTNSFARAIAVDPGFRPQHLVAATVALPRSRYGGDRAGAFYDEMLARVRALPGVESAALAGGLPPTGRRMSFTTNENGKESPRINVTAVGDGYVETIGGALVNGRSFTAADRSDAPAVAMINETAARVMFGGRNPLEQRIALGGVPQGVAIVGVMRDMVQRGTESGPEPFVFLPVSQDGASRSMTILARSAGDPELLENPIRQIVRSLDAAQPLPTFTTMEAALSSAVAPLHFTFVLVGIFASVAALLAAVGLYGLMAYLVDDRTREIGIRVALGADRSNVVRTVVGNGMTLTLIGLVAGFFLSLAAVRLLRTMLYHVSMYDPWTFVAGATVLTLAALLACYLPARRATRLDPMVALRAE